MAVSYQKEQMLLTVNSVNQNKLLVQDKVDTRYEKEDKGFDSGF